MITVDDVRALAIGFPGVHEVTHHHYHQPRFTVSGRSFAGIDAGGATAVFSVRLEEARARIDDDPSCLEEVWRPGATRSFVGVRVDLALTTEECIRELMEDAWRNKAAKRAITAYDVNR